MNQFLEKNWSKEENESRGTRPKRLRGPAGTVKRMIDGQWIDVPVYESYQVAVEREERKATR